MRADHRPISRSPQRQSLWWEFFLAVYGLTGLFWVSAALWGPPEPAPITLALHYLGGAMPCLAAIAFVWFRENAAERKSYWLRAVDGRRIAPGWWAVIVLSVPLLTGLAAAVDALAGGAGLMLELAAQLIDRPLGFAVSAGFIFLFGPLPEELAWRGYALNKLQAKFTPLLSSLIIAVVWTGWHAPLFFIEGSFQAGRADPVSVAVFIVSLFAQSIVFTWVFNHTRQSTLSAICLHFMVNFVGELFALSLRGEVILAALWVVAAAAIVIWADKRSALPFSRQPRLPRSQTPLSEIPS